jgi:hypothetical protein
MLKDLCMRTRAQRHQSPRHHRQRHSSPRGPLGEMLDYIWGVDMITRINCHYPKWKHISCPRETPWCIGYAECTVLGCPWVPASTRNERTGWYKGRLHCEYNNLLSKTLVNVDLFAWVYWPLRGVSNWWSEGNELCRFCTTHINTTLIIDCPFQSMSTQRNSWVGGRFHWESLASASLLQNEGCLDLCWRPA